MVVGASTTPATSVSAVTTVWTAGTNGRTAESGACDFGNVFFCVVQVLAIVPVSSCKILSLDCNCGRPSCSSACSGVSLLSGARTMEKQEDLGRWWLTAAVRDDVEGWSGNSEFAAFSCALSGNSFP
jgi:hypothetical protein